MHRLHHLPRLHPLPGLHGAARGRLAAMLAGLLLLTACGGGGGSDGAAAAGASAASAASAATAATSTAFTQGTLTGFGSLIVNGLRFDDSSASVSDDSGNAQAPSALRLGMRLEIDSGLIDSSTATARAHAVRFGGEVTGPVQAVDATAGTLTVLGQGVDVGAATVFDDSLGGGLGAVATGSVLEVHGLRDSATGRILATRIEAKPAAAVYKLRGVVSALDSTAKTLRIGAAAISYAAVGSVPGSLADGVSLRLTLATTAVDGVWQALALGTRAWPSSAAQAHVRGAITAFSSASAFSVDGIPVDASGASFPDGSSGLALGVQVDVQGTLRNGSLVATTVALEAHHRGDDDRRFELHGSISAVDTAAKTFVLRGVTVSHAGAVSYVGGTEAGLVVGARVDVRGTVGSSRNTLAALRIRFES